MKRPWISSVEQLVHWHLQVSQVPDDPEDQAEEDKEGSWEDKEIPEAEGGKDPNEEQDEACGIQEDGDEEKNQASADVWGIIHDRSSRLRSRFQQIIHSLVSLSVRRGKC